MIRPIPVFLIATPRDRSEPRYVGQQFGTCMNNIPAMIQFAMSGGIIGVFKKIKLDYTRLFYKYSVHYEIIGKGGAISAGAISAGSKLVSLDNNSAGSIRDEEGGRSRIIS